jgi:hypothetical protein
MDLKNSFIKCLPFFNKAYNLSSNGANVYAVVKYNRKFFIFNSRSDKKWPFSEIILVSDIIFALFSIKNITTATYLFDLAT